MGLRDARAQLTHGHEGFMQAGDDAGGVVFRVEDALDHVAGRGTPEDRAGNVIEREIAVAIQTSSSS